MISIFFLGKTILTLCLFVLILRIWMHTVRVNFYNPFTQFIIKITQPVIGRIRKIIPAFGKWDTASWLLLYGFALLKVLFIDNYISSGFNWNLNFLWYAILAILHDFGYLLFWLLLFRAILSWFNRGQSQADELLIQLTEPLVAPIRRIIPPLGMIDISFMVIVFILIFLNMLAVDLFSQVWLLM